MPRMAELGPKQVYGYRKRISKKSVFLKTPIHQKDRAYLQYGMTMTFCPIWSNGSETTRRRINNESGKI